jgi:uncharacterized protein
MTTMTGNNQVDDNGTTSTSTTNLANKTNHPLSSSPLVGRRRGLGRSSRRRRQKLLEILRAEQSNGKQQHDGTTSASASTSATSSSSKVIPTDRHRIWPGVQERRRQWNLKKTPRRESTASGSSNHGDEQEWAPQDAARLLSQLGYLPGNALAIAARAKDLSTMSMMSNPDLDLFRKNLSLSHPEDPMVLLLYPVAVREENQQPNGKFKRRKRKRQQQLQLQSQLPIPISTDQEDQPTDADTTSGASIPSSAELELQVQGVVVEPFPTLYWLTLPKLRTLVSQLELQGTGILLEQRLATDPEAMTKMQRAHWAYGQERYQLLVDTDLRYIEQRKWQAAFDPAKRGVAGIRNPLAVKCLHAHVAHYLSGGNGSHDNVIGQWVMELLSSNNETK